MHQNRYVFVLLLPESIGHLLFQILEQSQKDQMQRLLHLVVHNIDQHAIFIGQILVILNLFVLLQNL